MGEKLLESVEELVDDVLTRRRRDGVAEPNVEYKMSVAEYQELTPYAGDLEENWAAAGQPQLGRPNLLVYGKPSATSSSASSRPSATRAT